MGENITTRGIDLLRLPPVRTATRATRRCQVTGLRNPCAQLDRFRTDGGAGGHDEHGNPDS